MKQMVRKLPIAITLFIANQLFVLFGGGNDFRIESDSNINKKSRSKLGFNYKHPIYLYQSKEAQTFLAGAYNFAVDNIEVFCKE